MRATELDRLMTVVLDGEATPAEEAALERELAADPALRERYDGWRATVRRPRPAARGAPARRDWSPP